MPPYYTWIILMHKEKKRQLGVHSFRLHAVHLRVHAMYLR